MTGYRLASLVSLLIAGLALGLLALFTGAGTLFFDDPHASYAAFLGFMERLGLAVFVAALVCRIGAYVLHRSGWTRAAVAVALGPALFVILGAVWLLLPIH